MTFFFNFEGMLLETRGALRYVLRGWPAAHAPSKPLILHPWFIVLFVRADVVIFAVAWRPPN